MEENEEVSTGTQSLGARARARLASWRVVGVFGGIYLVSQAALGAILQEVGSAEVLQLQTTLSPETFAAILEQWRDAGLLDTYASHYYLDFVHPVWYSALLAALLAKALDANDAPARWNAILAVPFIAGGLDVVENLVHVYYLATGDAPTTGPVVMSGLAANTKWTLAGLSLAAAAALGVRAMERRRRVD
ncbi:MAG: hypothetical protein ACOC97_01110 [Myxococcota bacterium]